VLATALAVLSAIPSATPARAMSGPTSGDEPPPLDRYFHQSWSAGSGLPQISVHDMSYDTEGRLWVATENGLARFDGTRFEVFDNATTPALASSWLTRIHRDRDDRLWLATVNNVAVFDGARFSTVPGADSSLGHVTGIVEEPTGRILVGGERLLRGDGRGALVPEPGWEGGVGAMLRQGDSLWIAGTDGRLVHRNGGREESFRLPAAGEGAVVQRLAWAQGRLWLATSAGLWALRDGNFEAVPLVTSSRVTLDVLTLATDPDDVLWVGTYDGLYRVARGVVVDRPDTAAPGHLTWVTSLLPDGDGGMWIGSRQNGLRHLWRIRAERLGREAGLADPNVWSFLADGTSRGIFVGTNSGVDLLRDGRLTPVVPGAALLPTSTAYSLHRDRGGRLWVGLRRGLVWFAAAPVAAAVAGGPPVGVADRTELLPFEGLQVNGFAEEPEGVLWVATSGGLFRIAGEAIQQVGAEAGLVERRIRFLLRTTSGAFWVGTENGLFVGRGGSFSRSGDHTLDGAFVTALLELPDGRIAAGTNDRGLFLQEGSGWRRLMPGHGLPSANVFFLGAVGDDLVVGFRDGVYRARLDDLTRATVERPLTVEVLQLDEGDQVGRARIRCCNGAGNGKGVLEAGSVWLPSLDGVVRVPLAGEGDAPPQARVMTFVQDETKIEVGGGLRLPPSSRNLEVHYGAVDFRYPGQLRYRYRLVGFDDDWVEAGPRALAIYTNLPPGEFRFEVAARHAWERWGPVAGVALQVPKRPIETWQVRLLLVVAALCLVLLGVRWRIERLRRRQHALEALVEARTRELQDANGRLEEMNRALAEASLTDPLTGLHNRRFLGEEIPAALARLQRARTATGRDLVVGALLIDLDHFKAVNDTFGHAVGDRVLEGAAAALRASVRGGDLLLRWGGEEFLIVVTDVERGELGSIAERLRCSLTRADGSLTPGRSTASLGFAAYPLPGVPAERQTWQSVLDLADHALYGAKAAGRDRAATIVLDAAVVGEWPEHVRAAQVEQWYAEGKARLVLSRPPEGPAPIGREIEPIPAA
jgi:diguanylate cyclase (GGDEF)-like protein